MTVEHAAIDLVTHLQNHHHIAYFVGGYVRDKLLKKSSSDIDIVTSASTSDLMRLFPKTIPVGINFGIMIVVHQGHPFEVATFRQDLSYKDGRHPEGVVHATPEEDAKRRDFTINGLFYDPVKDLYFDYVGGKKDLERKLLRAIGDPRHRFLEDRLRMLRAARYAAVYDLEIDPTTKMAIIEMAPDVCQGLSIERIYQELEKMHQKRRLGHGLEKLLELHLIHPLFPQLSQSNELLKTRIQKIKKLPPHAPLIFGLVLLFDLKDKQELSSLILYFKAPNTELHAGERLLDFLSKPHPHPYELALFFASPLKDALIHTQALHEKDPEGYLKQMDAISLKLQPVIEKIQSKTPIVNASLLLDLGVPKGPRIKQLMDDAMRLYAENPHMSEEEVLKELTENF